MEHSVNPINYNNHAKCMAIIASELINKNYKILDSPGVIELISLYLLIPYITKDSLQTPDISWNIPKLDGEFLKDIKFANLRDSLCHSFATINSNDNINYNVVIDDRAILDRRQHDSQNYQGQCITINSNILNIRLKEIFANILK